MNRKSRERLDRFEVERSLGSEIRRLRENSNLGLVELAESAGISAGMLSKIEAGLVSPSITTLEALAHELYQPVGALFRTYDEQSATIVRAGQGIPYQSTVDGHIELLGKHAGVVVLQPWLITVFHGRGPLADLPQSGTGFVYVLEGVVEFACGPTQYELSPGDSLLFDASRANSLSRVSKYPARLLLLLARNPTS